MAQIDLYSQGSIYWYVNPFTTKNDYGKIDKNQDFVVTRPVLIISKTTDYGIFTLSSVSVAIISHSPNRVGIDIELKGKKCKILPYDIACLKKMYLKDYQGRLSDELLEEVLQGVDYHHGRTKEMPKYVLNAMTDPNFNPALLQDTDEDDFDITYNQSNGKIEGIKTLKRPTVFNIGSMLTSTNNSVITNSIAPITDNPKKIPKEEIDEKEELLPKDKEHKIWVADVYKKLHPIDKLYLNTLKVAEIVKYFKAINISWPTAKKIKLRIEKEFEGRDEATYCIDSFTEIIGTNVTQEIDHKLKYMSSIKDMRLFVKCHTVDLSLWCNINQATLESYKKRFAKEITEQFAKNANSQLYFNEE